MRAKKRSMASSADDLDAVREMQAAAQMAEEEEADTEPFQIFKKKDNNRR